MGLEHTSATAKRLPFWFLEHITDNFSEERIIGYGGFGVVYKGVFDNGEVVAVKKILYNGGLGEAQFKNELMIHLMGFQHQNIVPLVGYCYDTRKIFAQYEGKVVSAANILLDKNMRPKIGDFGISRLLGSMQTCVTETVTGTFGYMPPEYIDWREISPKFDIFSLGVLMIDVIAGQEGYKKCADMPSQQFIERVQENWESRLGAAMSWHTSWQVKTCTKIALRCMEYDQVNRPTITEIVAELNMTDVKEEHDMFIWDFILFTFSGQGFILYMHGYKYLQTCLRSYPLNV